MALQVLDKGEIQVRYISIGVFLQNLNIGCGQSRDFQEVST